MNMKDGPIQLMTLKPWSRTCTLCGEERDVKGIRFGLYQKVLPGVQAQQTSGHIILMCDTCAGDVAARLCAIFHLTLSVQFNAQTQVVVEGSPTNE